MRQKKHSSIKGAFYFYFQKPKLGGINVRSRKSISFLEEKEVKTHSDEKPSESDDGRTSNSRRYSTSDVEHRKENFKGKLFDVLFSEQRQGDNLTKKYFLVAH